MTLGSDTVPGNNSSTEVLGVGSSIAGCLETPTDQDWYQVSLAAGETVNFTVTGTGGLSDTILTVYDSGGGQLDQNDDRFGDRFSEVTFTAPSAGTYFVGVSSFAGAQSGDFTLTSDTHLVPAGPTTTVPVTVGGSVAGVVNAIGDQDWYRLALTAGQQVTIDMVGSGAAPLSDTKLVLWDNNGPALLSANNDFQSPGTSQLTFTAPATGDYFVAAQGENGATGDFTVSVSAGAAYTDGIPDTANTGNTLTSGTAVAGSFDYGTDDDWYRITTTGVGQYIDLLVRETGTSGHPVTLSLYDRDGVTQLATATSSNLDEATLYFPTVNPGTYFASVSFGAPTITDTSTYTLSGTARNADLGDTIQTSNVFRIDDTDPIRVYIAGAGEIVTDITADATTAYEQQRIMAGFAEWSRVADIQFVQVNDRAQADIVVGVGDTPPFGVAQFPGSGTPQTMRLSNRVTQWTQEGALDEGGFGYLIIIHEIGHLLGLNHTHDGDAGSLEMPGVEQPFNDLGDNDLNQEVYSVMSYNRGWKTGPLGPLSDNDDPTFGSGAGPAAIDIAAIQRMYGANMTTGAGDTVYLLEAMNGGYEAIWDVSGVDVIRHDGSSNAVIDLRAATLGFEVGGGGYVSHLPAFHGGRTIANGVVIENAVGGSGNDTITGNGADNVLFGRDGHDSILGRDGADTLSGNGGNDTLNGNDGADSLVGGLGDDVLIGGTGAEVLDGSPGGSDTLDYALATAALTVRLGNNVVVSTDAVATGDTIRNFENVRGGSAGDTLAGNHLANRLDGNGGNDTLVGNGGHDTLAGGAGLDSLNGGLGDDILMGGLGSDVLDGSPGGSDTLDYSDATTAVTVGLWNNSASGDAVATGDTIRNFENITGGGGGDNLTGNHLSNVLTGNGGNDTLNGSGGNDTLVAGEGADSLIGGPGDDVLVAGIGADVLDGSASGSDTLDYSAATSAVTVRLWNNTVSGDPIATGDTILNFENIRGGAGGDLLVGNHLNNVLTGNAGNDTLIAAAGNDTLSGGADNDNLQGGAGLDRLSGGTGRDFLTGGSDADAFVFASTAEAGIGADRDQIMDFQSGTDQIDVSDMVPGVFVFRGTAGFAPSGDAELRLFETGSGSTIVQFDVDGNGTIDAEVRVANVIGLTAGDFIL